MSECCEPRYLQEDEIIWKYMDDWKFSCMLREYSDHEKWIEKADKRFIKRPGQLWFSYPHSFGDVREGTFPAINNDPEKYSDYLIENRGLVGDKAVEFKRNFLSVDTQALREDIDYLAQVSGVSCWHINDQESALMWGKFTYNKNAIAVKTTVGDLHNAIRKNYSGISF